MQVVGIFTHFNFLELVKLIINSDISESGTSPIFKPADVVGHLGAAQ